jgi:hypothetical protein
MSGRHVVRLFLLIALVPVGWFGSAHWRTDGEAAVTVTGVHVSRPQLGRSGHAPGAFGRVQASSESTELLGDRGGRLSTGAPIEPPPPSPSADAIDAQAQRASAESLADGGPAAEARRRTATAGLPSTVGSAVKAGAPAPTTSTTPVIELTAVTQDLSRLEGDSFAADSVRELKITVWWGIPGIHGQRLELFSPTGALYRRFGTAFDGDNAAGGRAGVETRLPVGGTWITEYSLFGTWRVDVYLDDQPTPTTSAYFALNR